MRRTEKYRSETAREAKKHNLNTSEYVCWLIEREKKRASQGKVDENG